MSCTKIGANPAQTTTAAGFSLGDTHVDQDGNEFVYIQAGEALTANAAVLITEAGAAEMVDLTSTATAFGDRVGVISVAFDDTAYGWAQVYGAATVAVGSSCAANTAVNSTSTAGRVDDNATSGAEVIDGLVTTGAEASNLAACLLSYPTVGATL